MEITKFKSFYDNGREEEISKITLTDEEWLLFLRNLANLNATSIDTKQIIVDRDIEWIDTNRCVPLCANTDFLRRYEADTKLLSVVSEKYGDVHLRLWFAENGVYTTLNKVMEEVFPGALTSEILQNFWKFWSGLPMETQVVGNRVVVKKEREFGIGHLAAWFQQILKEEEPQIAWKKFLFLLRPWMYAHELHIMWKNDKLINNNDGRLSPIL
jgi:hypothetical protein